jgi:hypothetical protein
MSEQRKSGDGWLDRRREKRRARREKKARRALDRSEGFEAESRHASIDDITAVQRLPEGERHWGDWIG